MKQEFKVLAYASQCPMGKVLKPFAYNYLHKLYCERHNGDRCMWLLQSFYPDWYRCGQEVVCSSPCGEIQTQKDKGSDNDACWNVCDKLP